MDNLEFPGLNIAARRLGLDVGELAESVLHAVDCGAHEMEAVKMTIIEALQRRGAYHGRLRRAIEDGTIFQVDDPEANTLDLSGPNIRDGQRYSGRTKTPPRAGKREIRPMKS